MLVILRVTIGWHFLYEGVWKIANADKFSATALMSTAKGPAAPLFLGMVPDIDGRQRLELKEVKDEKGNPFVTSEAYANVWTALHQDLVDTGQLSQEQVTQASALSKLYQESLRLYLTENREDIEAHFESLKRFEARRSAGTNGAEHEKKRIYDEQQKLRSEVNGWLSDLDTMGENFRQALCELLDDDQKSLAPAHAAVSEAEVLPVGLPLVKTKTQFFDYAITYGLAAIGLCLMVGFCTRLAALGGAAFLVSVLLVQPPWPTIFPHAPAVVGHALIVDKNFVEMIALLTLAATAVGRWGGLDFFVYHCLGRPILSRCGCCKGPSKDGEEDS